MRTNRRAFLATIASAASASLAGCTVLGDAGDRVFGGEDYDVEAKRNSFDPEVYEVAAGETVVWKNTSAADHTVTAYDEGIPDGAEYFASGGFESYEEADAAWRRNGGGGFSTRETYAHTFEVPGTYYYACIPHLRGGMEGTIVVTE